MTLPQLKGERSIRPSWTARSTAGVQRAACLVLEHAPLMAVMDDLRSEKQRWQRSQAMTLL